MKKLFCGIMAIGMAAMMTACGSSGSAPATTAAPAQPAAEAAKAPEAKAEEKAESKVEEKAETKAAETEAAKEAAPEAGGKTGGVLKAYLPGDLSSLDYFGDRVNQELGIYERILIKDAEGNYHGMLVDSFESDKDAMTYTFHMFDQPIKFHDGSELTSEVFAWNINEYIQNGYFKASLKNVDNAEAVDDKTFVLHMKEWDTFIPNYLTRMVYVISKDFVDKNGWEALKEQTCGTGPFKLKAWNRGESIETERFDDYRRGTPKLDGIEYHIYSAPEVAVMALQNGELDILDFNKVSYSFLEELAANPDVTIYEATRGGTAYTLGFNCNNPDEPISDVRVREAICHAIDTDAIGQVLTEGYYFKGSHQWSVNEYAYCSDKVTGFEYDPALAKKLLEEAGYANGFSTTLKVQAAYEDAAVLVQQFLAEVGITCEVESLDRANFDKFIGGWDSGMLIHTVGVANGQEYQIINSARSDVTNGFGSGSFVHSPELDELCEKAAHGTLEESYENVKQIAETMFQNDISMYTLALSKGIMTARTDVKDAGICGDGSRNIADLHMAWLDR